MGSLANWTAARLEAVLCERSRLFRGLYRCGAVEFHSRTSRIRRTERAAKYLHNRHKREGESDAVEQNPVQ